MSHKIKDFVPLIVALVAVILGTAILAIFRETSLWPSLMADMMGMFFLVFGFMKVIKLKGFAEAFAMYDIIAKRSHAYALVYPLIELLLAAAYVARYNPVLTNSVTAAIMAIGMIGIYQKIQKKETIPCACLGVVFKLPMTKVTLVENGLMLVMALVMLGQVL